MKEEDNNQYDNYLKSDSEIAAIWNAASAEEELEYKAVMENNWLLEPTRQFSIQMNFINYDLGIIMTLYVAM